MATDLCTCDCSAACMIYAEPRDAREKSRAEADLIAMRDEARAKVTKGRILRDRTMEQEGAAVLGALDRRGCGDIR